MRINKTTTFEQAMDQLAETVARLESGEESLETSLKLYEEGSALAAFCYAKLQNAEQRIRAITDLEPKKGEKHPESEDDEA